MAKLTVQQDSSGTTFPVKVIAGGTAPTKICGLLNGTLKIKVSAAPEKGKANKCLISFLAEIFGVNKREIKIVSGQTNPNKYIKVSNISADSLLEKLNLE